MIRYAKADDFQAIIALYRRVAETPGGIARLRQEITEDYVKGFMSAVDAKAGIELVCEHEGQIVGEIHANTLGIHSFSHVLTELTIAVSPEHQGIGVGRQLFEGVLTYVRRDRPVITRIELMARESNTRAITFYQSLGFVVEGRLRQRIKTLGGEFEDDILLAWLRSDEPLRA